VSRHLGTIGVVATALGSGQSFGVNADQRFIAASLYKLFVLDAAEAAIESGALDPARVLTMTPAMAAADPYADLQAGTRITVDCALHTMVEMSGNSAADMLEDRVGGDVASRLEAEGLDHTVITSERAFTSPSDVAKFLQEVARGEAVSTAASRRMLDLLRAQQQSDRLPVPLPLNVEVAHKTGELPGVRHDAGIVFAPSGAYVLVVMVQDAPSESEARAAIVDVSQSVYAALEPSGLPRYLGLAPRLAAQVFRTPDAEGRLAMLGDPRTETAAVPSEVSTVADAEVRLRAEVFGDLVVLQQAAARAGAPFWVRSGFVQPTDAEAGKTVPTAWIQPCPIEQPERIADRPTSETDVAAARARQIWLGTVLSISDSPAGPPETLDDRASVAWQWLVSDGAEFGFVPAMPESTEARAAGHEPWMLRWVGRDMAARLRPVGSADYAARAATELQRAEADLASQDPHAKQPPLWGLTDSCWSVATWSGRGCPSRWYFLGLPLT
jgi:beta-lactamase class A